MIVKENEQTIQLVLSIWFVRTCELNKAVIIWGVSVEYCAAAWWSAGRGLFDIVAAYWVEYVRSRSRCLNLPDPVPYDVVNKPAHSAHRVIKSGHYQNVYNLNYGWH